MKFLKKIIIYTLMVVCCGLVYRTDNVFYEMLSLIGYAFLIDLLWIDKLKKED